jgi:hypothetical protein
VVLNLIGLTVGCYLVVRAGGFDTLKTKALTVITGNVDSRKSPKFEERYSLFTKLAPLNNPIVFLGDSLIERCEWRELMQNQKIVNRGISGDTTSGVLDRLSEITSRKPEAIFIMIGINDISNKDTKNTVKNYRNMLSEIKRTSLNTKIYIQSVLPVNNTKYPNINNQEVIALNDELKLLAKEENVVYIDLYPSFTVNDQLDEKYTLDGIHLNGAGYLIWRDALSKYL